LPRRRPGAPDHVRHDDPRHLAAIHVERARQTLRLIRVRQRLAAQKGAQDPRFELRPPAERCLRDALHLALKPGAERLGVGDGRGGGEGGIPALPVRGGKPGDHIGWEFAGLCAQHCPEHITGDVQRGRVGIERRLALHRGVKDACRKREGRCVRGCRHEHSYLRGGRRISVTACVDQGQIAPEAILLVQHYLRGLLATV
jgi:hypothetical protein